jgi:hypothetical protein
VTREETEREQERLSEENPEATWLLREEDDASWTVVRVGLPRPDDTRVEEKEERSRPPYPDDPVGSTRRNFGTFGAN